MSPIPGNSVSKGLFCRLKLLVPMWVALAVIVCAMQSQAQPITPTADVRTVITNQIEAFRRDDAAGAYALAAPRIQAMFPTPEIFMTMVRRGYAPVYRPSAYGFEEAHWRTYSSVMQPVRIEWQGHNLIAVYQLERQASGEWKITGVVLAKDDRQGA